MEPEKRSPEEIRLQLTTERAELNNALTDLRADVREARRKPMIIGGVVLAGLALIAVIRAVRD